VSRYLLTLPLLLLAGCPAAQPAPAPTVWLETGTAPGQVVYPRGIAYDPGNDWIYIVDRTAHIQRLSATGAILNAWHTPESRKGKPVGLTVGPDGNLYVADTHYNRILVYSPDGVELRRFGSSGTGPGEFTYPTDIAFDPAGNLYIAEYGDNDRIQVFSPDFRYLRTISQFGYGPTDVSRPQSIVILNRLLYAADSANHRIQVFTLEGAHVRSLGGPGEGPGLFRFPYGLDLTHDGNLLVSEFGGNRIQILSPTGTPLAAWGTGGKGVGELSFPWAAIEDNRGRTLILDAGNNRIQVLGPDALRPRGLTP
jgi:DNA-binding beta-propeller fold protein YncE